MAPYLITFALAIASVAMWTLRVTITSRGNRAASSLIAMVEATTYLGAVSHITSALDAPSHLVVYAIGVGSGTYAGLTLDRRLQRSPRSVLARRTEVFIRQAPSNK